MKVEDDIHHVFHFFFFEGISRVSLAKWAEVIANNNNNNNNSKEEGGPTIPS